MIDRILKTYGEVNTTTNGYPSENIKNFAAKNFHFLQLKKISVSFRNDFILLQ